MQRASFPQSAGTRARAHCCDRGAMMMEPFVAPADGAMPRPALRGWSLVTAAGAAGSFLVMSTDGSPSWGVPLGASCVTLAAFGAVQVLDRSRSAVEPADRSVEARQLTLPAGACVAA